MSQRPIYNAMMRIQEQAAMAGIHVDVTLRYPEFQRLMLEVYSREVGAYVWKDYTEYIEGAVPLTMAFNGPNGTFTVSRG